MNTVKTDHCAVAAPTSAIVMPKSQILTVPVNIVPPGATTVFASTMKKCLNLL